MHCLDELRNVLYDYWFDIPYKTKCIFSGPLFHFGQTPSYRHIWSMCVLKTLCRKLELTSLLSQLLQQSCEVFVFFYLISCSTICDPFQAVLLSNQTGCDNWKFRKVNFTNYICRGVLDLSHVKALVRLQECFSKTHSALSASLQPILRKSCFCFHCYLWNVNWLYFNSKLLSTYKGLYIKKKRKK